MLSNLQQTLQPSHWGQRLHQGEEDIFQEQWIIYTQICLRERENFSFSKKTIFLL